MNSPAIWNCGPYILKLPGLKKDRFKRDTEEGTSGLLGMGDPCSAALQERYEKEVARQAENRGGGKGDGSLDSCPTVPETTSEQPALDSDGSGAISQQFLSEVELKLQTEREEKILLKEQLQNLEVRKTP